MKPFIVELILALESGTNMLKQMFLILEQIKKEKLEVNTVVIVTVIYLKDSIIQQGV